MNDRGKSRTQLRWNVKDTTGPRNAYVLASRTLFRIIGKCDAARMWKTAAAPRNKPPTVNDRAAMESRWSGVPICASCVTLGSEGTVRPVSSPANLTAFRRFRYSTPCGHGQKPNTRSSRVTGKPASATQNFPQRRPLEGLVELRQIPTKLHYP